MKFSMCIQLIGAKVWKSMKVRYLCVGLFEVFIIGRVLGKLSTGGGKVKDLTLAGFHLVTVLGN